MKTFFAGIYVAVCWSFSSAALASADVYGKLPGLNTIDLSPKGTRYALVTEIQGQPRLVILNEQDKPIFVNPLPDAKIRGLQWASEDHLFVEVSDTQNLQAMFGTTAEITNVLWINIRDRRAGFVFKDSPGIVNAVFGLHGTAEVDGAAYGYFAGIPLRKSTSSRAGYDWDPSMDVDLFRVDLSDGDVRAEARSVANGDHDWIVGPDGKVAATAIYFTKDGTWRLHAGEGKNQPLREEKTPIRQLSLASLGRSAETFLISDRTGENDELQEVNAKTGEKTPILEDYNILGLIHDPVTHLLLGAQIAERPGAMFFDERLDARWRSIQKTFPGVILRLISWNTGMTWAIVRSEGSRDSGTLWKVDMTTGTTKLLGYAYPAIRADRVGPNRMFQYKAQDGLEMEGVLTLPATGVQTNLPVVVMPHGGPIGPYDGIGFD